MVTKASYALLAALLPWAGSCVRRNLDALGVASTPDPTNEDRMECLRQDNLDLAGTNDFGDRFILRKVLGVAADNADSDIYLFAEKLHISQLQADLRLTRTGKDAVEFELLGHNSVEQQNGVGRADVWISGFEVRTNNNLISWASSLAANRELLSQGQNGTVHFALGGQMRAKKDRGSWVAELISTEVRYFKFNFKNQKILDFALNRYGGLDKLILDNLFRLIESALPVSLLASLQFLPQHPDWNQEHQDFWLDARMKLSGHMDGVNGDLVLDSSLDVVTHLVPARLLDVFIQNYNVESLAEELVGAFLEDPNVVQALQNGRKSLIENLHDYRFVISDQLKSLLKEQVDLESLRPVLLEQARKMTSDLLVQILQPFLKAYAEGKVDYFKGFKVQLAGDAGWDPLVANGLVGASLFPGEVELQVETEDGAPVYGFAEVPFGLLDALGLSELLPKIPSNGTSSDVEFRGFKFDESQILLALASVSNWAQRPGANTSNGPKWSIIDAEAKDIALKLPQAWAQIFGVSCTGGKISIDPEGKMRFFGGRNGIAVAQTVPMDRSVREGPQRSRAIDSIDGRVPKEFQRPTVDQWDLTVVDRINILSMEASLDVVGNDEGGLQTKIHATLQLNLPTKSLMVSALAALPTEDFGYIFFADDFTWKKSSGKILSVMVVLNCGFLRLFEWPLRLEPLSRLEMKNGQLQFNLVGMQDPVLEDSCVLLKRMKANYLFRESEVTESLCATDGKAEALQKALLQQLARFKDSRAEKWRYGTHLAGKPQYVLPTDTVQSNLLTIVDGLTWGKLRAHRGEQLQSHPVLLQSAASDEAVSARTETKQAAGSAGNAEGQTSQRSAQHTRRTAPKVPSHRGSFEAQACRAQVDLDTFQYPPETHGNASIRLVIPATPVGDVHVVIEHIQVVSFDIVGKLVRNSDTTFLFEIEGADGPGTAQAHVEGIDFKAPDSSVPGITKAASAVDGFFRPVFTFGQVKADSLKEGPLTMTFKVRGEFKLSEGGHWEVLPKAVSDVKFKFGRGGLVQGLINYWVDAYGNMDDIFLTSVWPVLASVIPESLGQAFVQIPHRVGRLSHQFSIQGRCLGWNKSQEKCDTDQVRVEVRDVTRTALLPKPLTEKYLLSQNCSKDACEAREDSMPLQLLRSYADASSEVTTILEGTSIEMSADMEYLPTRFPKILLQSSADAPMKILEIVLGNSSSSNLANLLPPAPGKLTAVGAISVIEGNKVVLPEVRLERLRLPLLLDGQKEALELNLTLVHVKATSDGPTSIVDVLVGHFDVVLDQVSGLVLQKNGPIDYPQLDITVNREYVNETLTAVEHDWPKPLNVRTADASRPDGEVPEAFRQKQALLAGQLDIHKALGEAYLRAAVTLLGDRDPAAQEDMLNFSAGFVLHATLDLGSNFWRAVVTRRMRDFGFVHVSTPGVWGPLEHGRLPTQRAFLDVGCGQLRIFDFGKDAKPYATLLHSAELYDIWSNPEGTLDTEEAGPCIFVTESWNWQKYYFCAEAKPMSLIRKALQLQWTRFSKIVDAMEQAKEQDVASFEASRAAGYGAKPPSKPAEVFGDSTWFRQFNPFDITSWAPDLPPASGEDVETPLQRWARAKK